MYSVFPCVVKVDQCRRRQDGKTGRVHGYYMHETRCPLDVHLHNVINSPPLFELGPHFFPFQLGKVLSNKLTLVRLRVPSTISQRTTVS